MGSIGTPEIILVFALALLLFGPKKLPDLAKSLGRAVAEFKKASSEMRETIEKEVEDLKQTDEPQSSNVDAEASGKVETQADSNNTTSPVQSTGKPANKS